MFFIQFMSIRGRAQVAFKLDSRYQIHNANTYSPTNTVLHPIITLSHKEIDNLLVVMNNAYIVLDV